MSVLLWPFRAIWALVTGILGLTGRLVAILLGVTFIFAGVALTLTVVGAIAGIPLVLLGFALLARGLF